MLSGFTLCDVVALVGTAVTNGVRSAVADCRWVAAVAWDAYQESRRRR